MRKIIIDELGKWIRPIVVYVVCTFVYNLFVIGSLVGLPGEFSSVKTDSKYKIACNFEIKNKGFLTVKTKKFK